MHIVLLEDLVFHSYHGVFDEERKIGGKFEVNLVMRTDFTEGMETDNLEGTIDYSKAYSIVAEEMNIPAKLMEHVGHRIVGRLKSSFEELHSISLKISKLSPPISGDIGKVSIVIEE